MFNIKIDTIEFRLKEYHDLSWIKEYGTVFYVIDQTGSGCICFGVANDKMKYFIKVAGVNTVEAEVTPMESIITLKNAMNLYNELDHPNLIKIIEHYSIDDLYVAVFEWADGECLFDHWNFEKYSKNPHIKPPALKYKELSIEKRLKSVDTLFSFLERVASQNYVTVDFYDGSIMYDFIKDKTTICDIDFFRKKPTINDIGAEFWGTKRLKSPEEYVYGAPIDESTNVFTLGALIFNIFGNYADFEIKKRYERNTFYPCSLERWELSMQSYESVMKAIAVDREKRYSSITEFCTAWNKSLCVN